MRPIPAQAVDAVALLEAPLVRAAVSFGGVLAVGAFLATRHEGFVDRSVDAVLARPWVSVLYGFVAYGLVVTLGAYAVSQLAALGGGPGVATGALAVVAGVVLLLSGLGFLVTGSLVTALWGPRRPWPGLVIAASAGTVALLALPLGVGMAAWTLLAAFGLGGPTRRWIHASRAAGPDG